MTTKLTSESNLWEAKEKLEGIKVQMEASYLLGMRGGGGMIAVVLASNVS